MMKVMFSQFCGLQCSQTVPLAVTCDDTGGARASAGLALLDKQVVVVAREELFASLGHWCDHLALEVVPIW